MEQNGALNIFSGSERGLNVSRQANIQPASDRVTNIGYGLSLGASGCSPLHKFPILCVNLYLYQITSCFIINSNQVFMYSNEWGGKMKKRIGIYHYQYYRGACKLCYRHFIQEMVESYEKCHEVAEEIYGKENCEFLHYTDFGQYDSENTDRPSFRRIMEAIEKKELDVVMCYGLNNITINEELLIKFYKYVRSQGMEFLTADHGRDAMKYIDIYIEKNNL